MTVMTPTMTICSTLGPTDSTPMTATDTSTFTTTAAGTAATATGDEAKASSTSSTSCSRSGRPTSVADARTSNTQSPNSNSNKNNPTIKANVKYRGEEGRKAVLTTCRKVLYDYGVLCSVVIVELHSAADVDVLSAHPDVAWVDADVQVSFIAPMNTGIR